MCYYQSLSKKSIFFPLAFAWHSSLITSRIKVVSRFSFFDRPVYIYKWLLGFERHSSCMSSLKRPCHLHFYCPGTRNFIVFSLLPCKCHCLFWWSCPCSLLVWQQSCACHSAPSFSPAVLWVRPPSPTQPSQEGWASGMQLLLSTTKRRAAIPAQPSSHAVYLRDKG